LREGGGLNGTFILTDATVHDDRHVDVIIGSAGRDWIIANLDKPAKDLLRLTKSNDAFTDID
jgi:hypothetical protein